VEEPVDIEGEVHAWRRRRRDGERVVGYAAGFDVVKALDVEEDLWRGILRRRPEEGLELARPLDDGQCGDLTPKGRRQVCFHRADAGLAGEEQKDVSRDPLQVRLVLRRQPCFLHKVVESVRLAYLLSGRGV
jgi:hypothetical protein